MTAVRPAAYKPTLADYERNHGVLMDGLESLWIATAKTNPPYHDEIVKALQDLREFHNHDQEDEDEHCDPSCPAWFPGCYCSACDKRHRKIVAV